MLWAAACLCFSGFLRAGEMTVLSDKLYDPGVHLNFEDVAINSKLNPSIMRVNIKASKMDPFCQGVEIFVGRICTDLCPIKAMLAYLVVCEGAQGPLFSFDDGRLLTRERFVTHVREAAGIGCKSYARHCFRIGVATASARRGIQDAGSMGKLSLSSICKNSQRPAVSGVCCHSPLKTYGMVFFRVVEDLLRVS